MLKVGQGFDIHPLVAGKPLILGGIHIPYDKGLLGHSDGDVLTHALIDALIGSMAEGDIGSWFPTNQQNLGRKSTLMLEEVVSYLQRKKFRLNNVDSTIILESPKLQNYLLSIRENLASHLGISLKAVSVKAKTHEGLDSLGENLAACAQVIVLVESYG